MKLQHTLGGLQGLGPVDFQKKVFVEKWETRIFGIHTAMMALSTHLENSIPDYSMDEVPTTFKDIWTWADLRRGAESISPFAYFQFRYYEKWLGGITGFFLDKGYITQEELDLFITKYLKEGNMEELALPTKKEDAIDQQIIKYLEEGDSGRRETSSEPLFSEGQSVVVKDPDCSEHTRLPGYLRNKVGTIELVYPDSYAYFPGPSDHLQTPQVSYSVKFLPENIWGKEYSETGSVVYADLFECYLSNL